jgi:hypothetical protein
MQVENQHSGPYIRDETLKLKLYQSAYTAINRIYENYLAVDGIGLVIATKTAFQMRVDKPSCSS